MLALVLDIIPALSAASMSCINCRCALSVMYSILRSPELKKARRAPASSRGLLDTLLMCNLGTKYENKTRWARVGMYLYA